MTRTAGAAAGLSVFAMLTLELLLQPLPGHADAVRPSAVRNDTQQFSIQAAKAPQLHPLGAHPYSAGGMLDRGGGGVRISVRFQHDAQSVVSTD